MLVRHTRMRHMRGIPRLHARQRRLPCQPRLHRVLVVQPCRLCMLPGRLLMLHLRRAWPAAQAAHAAALRGRRGQPRAQRVQLRRARGAAAGHHAAAAAWPQAEAELSLPQLPAGAASRGSGLLL